MDLLQSVRKEGSRGGVNFSWDDVKTSNHRENYLGHSLMAPVGRWAKNKDLNWYAKADDAELTPEERAAKEAERKGEEKRKVKEAEEDAMARALGLPVPDRSNANNEPLGESKISQKDVNKALKEALGDDEEDAGRSTALGSREKKDKHRSSRDHGRRDRSRSRDRCRHRDDRDDRRRRRSRSRSRDNDRERRRHRHRSRTRSRSRNRDHRERKSGRRENDNYRPRHDRGDRPRSRDRERRRARTRSRSPYDDRRRRRDGSR